MVYQYGIFRESVSKARKCQLDKFCWSSVWHLTCMSYLQRVWSWFWDSEIIQYVSVYCVYARCCVHNHDPRIMQDTVHFLLWSPIDCYATQYTIHYVHTYILYSSLFWTSWCLYNQSLTSTWAKFISTLGLSDLQKKTRVFYSTCIVVSFYRTKLYTYGDW